MIPKKEVKPDVLLEADESVKIASQEIGYTKVLMLHLNRISFLSTQLHKEGLMHAYFMSVIVLEKILKPYLDALYVTEKQKLDEQLKEKKYSGKQRLRFMSDNLLAVLMELMARKNLLLTEDQTEKI